MFVAMTDYAQTITERLNKAEETHKVTIHSAEFVNDKILRVFVQLEELPAKKTPVTTARKTRT